MYLENNDFRSWDRPWEPLPSTVVQCSWTVLIPFFNERDMLDTTLSSLAAQDMRFELILIDNGSTDGSGAVAAASCRRLGLDFTLLLEPRPGKVNALAAGVERVRTCYVATCDADTTYPSDYLRQAARLLDQGAAAAGAYFVTPDAAPRDHAKAARRITRAAAVLPDQCHTGGAGQVFRTTVLRRVGQFDARRWGYVLEDHEIMHRVAQHGTIAYGERFWCAPSPRERDRGSIRWTLTERLAYHLTPRPARDWFFYSFLANRLAGRRLTSDRIRERSFQDMVQPIENERLAA
ncbi:glycosyltransferase family A protein [Sphingomonas sp. CARO-RG-8B-R24-01]|uniref:glycosyltransferase n=1 Tax=Sphingomonas sp. CARO-RG-8B-R24-01 TaxID=2914831 RepID=UPI001F58D675|nr:glycosyltransferase family A protein [Sphingomonas sp. CARO-RG-8B-R24-01]